MKQAHYKKEFFDAISKYGRIKVVSLEEGNAVLTLMIDDVIQIQTRREGSFFKTVERVLSELGEGLEVLHIGLGLGMSLSLLAESPKVRSIDMIEINEEMVKACEVAKDHNHNVLKNEKVNLIVEDGFKFVQKIDKKYDLILIDVLPSNLESSLRLSSSLGAFKHFKRLLNPNGLLHVFLAGEALMCIEPLKECFPDLDVKQYTVNDFVFRWR